MSLWPKSTKARRRLTIFLVAAPLLIAAVALSFYALKGTAIYFYTPAQMVEARVPVGQTIRLGGLVKTGSVEKLADGSTKFIVMDKLKETTVVFKGDLPDLFREGQGVVCEGDVTTSGLRATQVLAKHDETYMPKNVKEELERQGEWRPDVKPAESRAERPFGT